MKPRVQRAIEVVLASVAVRTAATPAAYEAPLPVARKTLPPARGVIYVDDDNTSGPWDGTPEHPYRHIRRPRRQLLRHIRLE